MDCRWDKTESFVNNECNRFAKTIMSEIKLDVNIFEGRCSYCVADDALACSLSDLLPW